MTWLRALPLLILTVLAVALLAYTPSGAADDNRVAVIIDYGNDQIAKRCVSFSEASITGFEALERTGLAVETDFQTGGAAVCRIDSQGCPANDCFCACRGGGDCMYWSYWHFTNGTWNYSAAGSGIYQVTDGAVEGWVWGLGSVTQAQPPPDVSFAEVCAAAPADTPTSTATPSPTATPIILPTAQPTSAGPAATATGVSTTAATTMTTTTALETVAVVSPTAVPAGSTPVAPPATAVRITATLPATEPGPPAIMASSFPAVGSLPESAPAATQPLPPPETIPAAPANITTSSATLPAEPTGGLLVSSTAESGDQSTATSIAMAVIGAEAVAPAAAGAMPAAPTETTAGGGAAYAGFVGLLLLLGALALFVYRRRAAEVRS